MAEKIIFFILLLISKLLLSQQVSGTVKNDAGDEMTGVTVLNLRTNQMASTDRHGQFILEAKPMDELRFAKAGFERIQIKLSEKNFAASTDIVLQLLPADITEVKVKFKPSGDLKKDLQYFRNAEKVMALNSSVSNWSGTKPNSTLPDNKIPSAFVPKNLGEGQIPLIGFGNGAAGLLGMVVNALVKKKTSPEPSNFAETQQFYAKIKNSVDMEYFRGRGMDDFAFEKYLLYADKTFNLTKRYARNFNLSEIQSILKAGLKDYLKTANA